MYVLIYIDNNIIEEHPVPKIFPQIVYVVNQRASCVERSVEAILVKFQRIIPCGKGCIWTLKALKVGLAGIHDVVFLAFSVGGRIHAYAEIVRMFAKMA